MQTLREVEAHTGEVLTPKDVAKVAGVRRADNTRTS